jgi:uncharacterized protein (TIGR02246 family)
MVTRLAAPLIAVALIACQNQAPSSGAPSATRDSVAAAMQGYVEALRSNDPASVSRWWTDDAVYMAQGTPTVRGRAALDSLVRGLFATVRVTDVSENTDELIVERDLAVQVGTYSETLQPQRGSARIDRGRYVFVWRRQLDGGWKIARGMSNASAVEAPR